MGKNIGWGDVGLMLITLGLSAITMHVVSVPEEPDPPTNWRDLAQQLVKAGDQFIAFCEEHGHLKHIGVTLILMNFILQTLVYGDAGGRKRTVASGCDFSYML